MKRPEPTESGVPPPGMSHRIDTRTLVETVVARLRHEIIQGVREPG
ncbi:MAG: hypothetical protein IH616_21650, partial [Gemmatimonadales bacterium]|nr:hypothetical protein [Gemmatimonadales bacterium]